MSETVGHEIGALISEYLGEVIDARLRAIECLRHRNRPVGELARRREDRDADQVAGHCAEREQSL